MTTTAELDRRRTNAAATSRLTRVWREHQALLGRWIARARREPLALLALLAQPMVWLVLFSNLFAQMAETAEVPGGDYLALVPIEMMPAWMQLMAQVNPLTYATDAIRSLVIDGWQPAVLARLTGALVLFNVLCVVLATAVLRRGLR